MATTQVRSKQQFLVTDHVNFQSFRITSLADPQAPQDAATKAYVDAMKQALDIKDSVRVATTGAETYTIVAGAVTQIAGTQVDGVTIAVGNRILIKNAPATSGIGSGTNTSQPANGLYVVTGATTNLTIQRSDDANISAEVTAGLYTIATEGTANADNGYVLTTNDAIVLNTTPLSFTQFSGAGQITAGNGLQKSGNTLSIQLDETGGAGTSNLTVSSNGLRLSTSYLGQTSITTLGTITTGVWNGTVIGPTFGGTGLSTYVLGDILFASAANTLARLAGNTVAAKRFLTQTGNGTVSAAPTWGTILATDIQSGANLTGANDTNVTLTLTGGTGALLSAVTLTMGWNGTLAIGRGGTNAGTAIGGFNNLSPLTTLGDTLSHNGTNNVRVAGNTTTVRQFLSQTGTGTVSALPVWAAIAGTDVTGAALSGANDTNVTLTFSANSGTALLRATQITVGWNGTLAVGRGGSGRDTATAFMPLAGGTTATGAHQSIAVGASTGLPLVYKGAATLPVFEALNLSDANVTSANALLVARGGTGQTSYVNGELLIGNTTGNTLTKATLTQGTGIVITNGNGSITIAVASTIYTNSNFVDREVPTGTINGTNPTFTIANTPTVGSEHVYVNGILQNVGTGNDYTISGATITFLAGAIPQTNDVVLVSYRRP